MEFLRYNKPVNLMLTIQNIVQAYWKVHTHARTRSVQLWVTW